MTILQIPTLVSFLSFLGLGTYVLLKNRRRPVNVFFALGMACLALMEFGNFMALSRLQAEAALFWKRIALLGECLVPGFWLAFALSFARNKPWYIMKLWKAVFIGVGLASVFFMVSVPFTAFATASESSTFLILGRVGKLFYVFLLMASVAIVANLEQTARQSKGDQRLQIRPFVLSVGGLFVYLIYISSQTLLFSRINLTIVPVSSSIFIICIVLMAFSVTRHRLMDVNLYMSRVVIYNSLTLVVVGAYLIFVGLGSQMLRSLDLLPGYPLEILFLFVSIFVLLALLLSNRIRWKARMLINKHFYRTRYDYREEWLKFSERLHQKVQMDDLALTTINMLQDAVGVNEISIWLRKGNTEKLRPLHASSLENNAHLHLDHESLSVLIEKKAPFSNDTPWASDFVQKNREILERLQPALLVPLVSGSEMEGMILLGKKTTGKGFLADDIDLLKSAAAQITGNIVNAKLSQELIRAKEMEVFHRFSSFVLHDLKNLVSSLSLVVQNASEHMSNPQFQEDTLQTIERSVSKMDALIAKLSNNVALEKPNFKEADLNELVSEVVSRMGQNGLNNKTLKVDLGNIPGTLLDQEQIEKVVTNLLLNAFEALDNGGLVTIKTEAQDEKVILSVIDSGRGMSPDYLEKSLFRPFNSTKKKGLGIGLYQCKTIVEAHHGQIEVQSQEGKGSTFRVLLPANSG